MLKYQYEELHEKLRKTFALDSSKIFILNKDY